MWIGQWFCVFRAQTPLCGINGCSGWMMDGTNKLMDAWCNDGMINYQIMVYDD